MADDDKPKVGTISLKNGKATIEMRDGPVAFDLDFVCARMVKGTKGRQSIYTRLIRGYSKELQQYGMREIPAVRRKLKTLAAAHPPF